MLFVLWVSLSLTLSVLLGSTRHHREARQAAGSAAFEALKLSGLSGQGIIQQIIETSELLL